MLATRRTLGLLCWFIASAVVVLAVTAAISITREYGISPNHNLALDLAGGFLTFVLPVALISGGLGWAGWRLWRPAKSARTALVAGLVFTLGAGAIALLWILT
jgi:hypothetical protein